MTMDTKILANLRINDLNKENDYLGVIEKGNLIKAFITGSKSSFHEIKMFSLYGDWGSGKSTLMKYIQNELDAEFNTFFFEAWEYEKDENLAMSLLQYITLESKIPEDEFYDEIIKYGGRILRGLGKSIKLSVPLFVNGPRLDLNPAAFVEELTPSEEINFHDALKKFKDDFQKLEDSITRDEKKYNIVFIDDLDRCEPQQVLNLMSAIKLFFTYGKKTIFLCGIDKKAVEEAVKTKYGNIIKANEYLEKIFDISFSMPGEYNLLKLISHYFDTRLYDFGGDNISINFRINTFFTELEFNNPRRVKKVLNKYQMLRDFKSMQSLYEIPNIDMKTNSERSYFETILILYLIILHEFYPSEFDGFLNFDKKKEVYLRAIPINEQNIINQIDNVIAYNVSKIPFSNNDLKNSNKEQYFYICFAPLNVQKVNINAFSLRGASTMVVEEKYIDYLFYKYINKYDVSSWLQKNSSETTLQLVKTLIKNLL